MILGSLWSVITLLTIFMVPVESEEMSEKKTIDEASKRDSDPSVADMEKKRDEPDVVVVKEEIDGRQCGDLRRIFGRPSFLFFLAYGFCQFGSLLGIQVLLPPLLIESFSPKNVSSTTTFASENISTATVTDAEELAQYRISLGISLFGIGGIVGIVTIGFILSWGKRVRFKIRLSCNTVKGPSVFPLKERPSILYPLLYPVGQALFSATSGPVSSLIQSGR